MLVCTISAGAAQLVYFDEDGGNGKPRGLYNFDTATLTSTLRTTVAGNQRYFSMDIRPSDGKLFAVSFSLNPGIYTIDLNNGVSSYIGPGIDQLVGLAFSPINGQLFGLANQGGLYSINQVTGQATFIGPTGDADRGLVFSPSGQLFGFSNPGALYRIDPTTGNVTAVGGTGNQVDCCQNDISEDATFTPAGELFATSYQGYLYKTDPVTGNGAIIGTTGMGSGLLGLVAVPEPSTVALFICAAGMIAFCFRRKGRSDC